MTVVTQITYKRYRDTVIRFYPYRDKCKWSFRFANDTELVQGIAPTPFLAYRQAQDYINERYNQLNFG